MVRILPLKLVDLSSEVTILHTTDHAGNPLMNALHSCCHVQPLKLSKSNPFESKCLVDDVCLSIVTVQHDIPKACDDNNDNDHNHNDDDNFTNGKNDDNNNKN